MRRNDARQLDHATLEAMRERAVRSVQDGEDPEVVAHVLGMGSVESQAAVRTSAEARWEEAAVDLQHGDAKEPVAAQVPICIVDAGDGGRSDQGQVQHLTEPGLGGAAFGAALLSCPKCDRNDDPSAYARRRRSRLLPAAQAL